MSDNRRYLEPPEDGEPLVTYSRIDPRRARPAPARDGRVEPHIDAREVPWTAEPESAPDLRAVPFDAVDERSPGLAVDPLSPPRKSRALRALVLFGTLAVIAGIGILVVSFGTAGLGTRGAPVAGNASAPAPAAATPTDAAAPPAAADGSDGAPAVREISLTGEDSAAAPDAAAPAAATAVAPAPPPVPRPRPERAVVEAPAGLTPEAEPSAPVAAVAPAAPATQSSGDEADFIARIEATLAAMPPAPTGSEPPAPAVMPAAPPAMAAPVDAANPAFPDTATEAGQPLDWPAAEPLRLPPVDEGAVVAAPAVPEGPIPPADIPNVPPAASGFQ